MENLILTNYQNILNFLYYSSAYIGIAVCLFAYSSSNHKLNTKPILIQITYIIYFLQWAFVYLADHSGPIIKVDPWFLAARYLSLTALIFTSLYLYQNSPKNTLEDVKERSLIARAKQFRVKKIFNKLENNCLKRENKK